MNLATMTAAPTILTVGGRSFKVGPFRYLELGLIQRYLDETAPSPLKRAEAETIDLPDEEREPILEKARRRMKHWSAPQVGDGPEWTSLLFDRQEGVVFFIDTLFSKHQEFTDEDLAHVLEHVGPKQMRILWAIAMEEPIERFEEAGEEDGPKGAAPPSTT